MTIRNTISAALLACTALSAQAGTIAPGPAPTPGPINSDFWTGSVTIGYDTDYIFRGYEISEDNAWMSLDLNFALADRWTLNFNAWYTNSTDSNYDELNLYTRLFYKVNDNFSFGPSFRWYNYPSYGDSDSDQYEPGLEFAWAPCANASVTGGVFYETETETLYVELGGSYTFKLTDRVSLVPGAVISYADTEQTLTDGESMWTDSVNGFNHATIYVKLPIMLKDNVTLTPYVAGNFPLDVVDDITGDDDEEIYGGVSLSVGF
jgi:hypothetical protein